MQPGNHDKARKQPPAPAVPAAAPAAGGARLAASTLEAARAVLKYHAERQLARHRPAAPPDAR